MGKKKKNEQPAEELSRPYVVTDRLDLHGFFPEQISEVIAEFIWNARRLKLRRLIVIHGKGKSKLKYLVRKELGNHPDVESYGDASPESGGWGRTIVILKESKTQ